MKLSKGFTLIELMVVIVIIGILSALALPKMFGVSAKAKAAEAPSVIANWETLQSGYAQETGLAGNTAALIGFDQPKGGTTATTATVSSTKWFIYTLAGGGAGAPAPAATLTAGVALAFGNCVTGATGLWVSQYTPATDANAHTAPTAPACAAYTTNF